MKAQLRFFGRQNYFLPGKRDFRRAKRKKFALKCSAQSKRSIMMFLLSSILPCLNDCAKYNSKCNVLSIILIDFLEKYSLFSFNVLLKS